MRLISPVLLAALILSAAAPALAAKVGQPAFPFKLKTFDGHTHTLDSLRGQVVVINYWATWCGPCKAELPAMDAYVRQHEGEGLRVFAVATENSVPATFLKPLAAALSFPLVARFSETHYGLIGNAVPTSYVIDRAGIVRYAKAGAFDAASFDATITPLLAERAPPPIAAAQIASAAH